MKIRALPLAADGHKRSAYLQQQPQVWYNRRLCVEKAYMIEAAPDQLHSHLLRTVNKRRVIALNYYAK